MQESSRQRKEFRRHGGGRGGGAAGAGAYVGRGAIEALHQLLRVQQAQSLQDFQSFFDLLQRCGEERGLLELSDEVCGVCVYGGGEGRGECRRMGRPTAACLPRGYQATHPPLS